ncbi:hypothetical protein NECAME_00312, partial [Necator americanus]
LILWRILRLRFTAGQLLCFWRLLRSRNINVTNRKPYIRQEARLAVNFLMLSACFLLMTLCFNVVGGKGMWQDLATKLSFNLNLSKLAIYALGNPIILSRILQLFGINKTISSITTISNVTRP